MSMHPNDIESAVASVVMSVEEKEQAKQEAFEKGVKDGQNTIVRTVKRFLPKGKSAEEQVSEYRVRLNLDKTLPNYWMHFEPFAGLMKGSQNLDQRFEIKFARMFNPYDYKEVKFAEDLDSRVEELQEDYAKVTKELSEIQKMGNQANLDVAMILQEIDELEDLTKLDALMERKAILESKAEGYKKLNADRQKQQKSLKDQMKELSEAGPSYDTSVRLYGKACAETAEYLVEYFERQATIGRIMEAYDYHLKHEKLTEEERYWITVAVMSEVGCTNKEIRDWHYTSSPYGEMFQSNDQIRKKAKEFQDWDPLHGSPADAIQNHLDKPTLEVIRFEWFMENYDSLKDRAPAQKVDTSMFRERRELVEGPDGQPVWGKVIEK